MTKKYNCILLVDDDFTTNVLNTAILSKLDLAKSIEVVNNGKDAIDYLSLRASNSGKLPELILLDINMPNMDGFDFLEKFNELAFENKNEVEIMILTSSDDLTDLKKCLNYKLSGYIVKPLSEKKILTLIGD